MAAEIIKVVDAVSEAKDVDREVLFEAIENAIEWMLYIQGFQTP